jgi:UDP-2,4-diacetamido-2,4,6-trideoxy-beta-L-altropyranose hydrolase
MPETLLIRADASLKIGTGHVMRCLALAQAWQHNGGPVIFAALNTLPTALIARLEAEGMAVHLLSVEPGSAEDAQQTIALARAAGGACVVVDGYHFDAEYQRRIKDALLQLLSIDDNGHAKHYSADWVLNQNIHADEHLYSSREPYTRLLLGTRYVLLRREFWKWQGWRREVTTPAHNVLITMGGSDPNNMTLRIMEALSSVALDSLNVVIVIGGSNPHYEMLHAAAQHSRHSIRLESNVASMPDLMAWAEIAISASGSTVWELLFMGVPSIVIAAADNQRPIAESLAQNGVSINLGWHEHFTPEGLATALNDLTINKPLREQMTRLAQHQVDGRGSTRLTTELAGGYRRTVS